MSQWSSQNILVLFIWSFHLVKVVHYRSRNPFYFYFLLFWVSEMGRAFQMFFKMWAQRFSVSQAPPAMIHLEAWNKVKLAKIPFEIFHFKKIQVAVLAGAAAAVALTILVCSYFLWLLVFILHLTFCNAPLASIWCGFERRALYMLVMLRQAMVDS